MTDQVKPASRPWRRFLRFNVRGLIVLVLVIAVVLGWYIRSVRIQRDAVTAIEKAGGLTFYNIPRTPVVSWHEPSRWRTLVGGYIGIDYAGHVCHVNFPQITQTGNDADRQGALARVGDLGQLETLDFAGMSVTDGDLASLDGLNRLQQLVLPSKQITDAGVAHLKALDKLTLLDLHSTQVTGAGLVHLKGLTSLFDVSLGKTQVSDAGLVHLKGLTNLRVLDLSGTQVTDAGLVQLKGLKKLLSLRLNDARVTDAGVKELRLALPSLWIDR
jgi:hypothetical protein